MNSLSTSKLELQAILDHLPSMIGYWDKQCCQVFANQAYKTWFGIAPEQAVGMHIREVIGEERYRLNLPNIEAAIRGETQIFERSIPMPDGKQVRHALVNYIPDIQDGQVCGFFVLISDISAVKQAEQLTIENRQLQRQNEEIYRSVVLDQTELISRLRADGVYLFANEVFCRFFGRPINQLIGSNWHPLVVDDDLPLVGEELALLAPDNPVVMIENRVYSATGEIHWMQFSNRGTFDSDGQLMEIQSVGRDITARKNAEAALKLAHEELQHRVEQLRALAVDATLVEERERRTIANDLHDGLGQLLHIAKLKLDALNKQIPQTAQAAISEIDTLIADASRSVRSLTAQLSPPVLQDLGLVAALHWLAVDIEQHFGLRVEVTDDKADKPLTTAQSALIFRAVRELLINVHKHAGVAEASVKISRSNDQLQITVVDFGVGFDVLQSQLSHRRGHGLVSIRERIDFIGGSTELDSSFGNGTQVTLRMPLHVATPTSCGSQK